MNQCWFIVGWNKCPWNLNQNRNFFIQENAFENVISKMATSLSWAQSVKGQDVKWGLCHQKQVSWVWISNYIPQNTVGCNYLSMPKLPASGPHPPIYCGHHTPRCAEDSQARLCNPQQWYFEDFLCILQVKYRKMKNKTNEVRMCKQLHILLHLLAYLAREERELTVWLGLHCYRILSIWYSLK